MTESLYQLTDTDSEEEREPSQHRDIGSRARDCGQWSLDITDAAQCKCQAIRHGQTNL